MRCPTPLCLLLVLVEAGAAGAQTADEVFAAIALRATHIGALTPLMSPAMIGRRLEGAQLALRYGLRTDDTLRTHAVAASAIFSVGLQSSVALTAGVQDANCGTCSPHMMLGIGGDMRVLEIGDAAGAGSGLAVAVSGDIGYGQRTGDDAITLGIGAPLTFSLPTGGRDGMHVVPFITPVFGIGQTSPCPNNDPTCSRRSSDTHWVLGGGVGVWNPMTSVSASIGVNQVMRTGEKPVFGINVVFGGR